MCAKILPGERGDTRNPRLRESTIYKDCVKRKAGKQQSRKILKRYTSRRWIFLAGLFRKHIGTGLPKTGQDSEKVGHRTGLPYETTRTPVLGRRINASESSSYSH